jgi:peptidoglycan/LPS O-acetylase OafA/YrhL
LAVATAHAKSETIATAKSRFYRPELDCLRFFAFCGVFIFHVVPRDIELYRSLPTWDATVVAGAINAGSFGVDISFALSAYLITTLLLREKQSPFLRKKGKFAMISSWPL